LGVVTFFLPFLIGLVINKITDNFSPGIIKSTTKSLLKKNNQLYLSIAKKNYWLIKISSIKYKVDSFLQSRFIFIQLFLTGDGRD